MKTNFKNEPAILLAASGGDQYAFRLLFDQHFDRVLEKALRLTRSKEKAADIVQEAFIKIWVSREKLALVNNFSAYLNKAVYRVFLDELRKQLAVHEAIPEHVPDNETPEHRLQQKQLETRMANAIDRLPEQMQRAFKLSRTQGLTHEQISRVMNISKVTSQNYIARALVVIRKQLAQYSDLTILLLLVTCYKG